MLRELVAVFFPNNCAACEQPMIAGESVVCTNCLTSLPYTDYHQYDNNPVEKLFWGRVSLQAGMALFYFNKGNRVQRLMHQLKYHKDLEVGLTLGRMLGSRIKDNPRFAEIDCVIPVPLHPKKLKKRGFNQSELIARGITEECGIPTDDKFLTRAINNPTQTKKSRFDRYKNVWGAFDVNNQSDNHYSHVLLVDDVVTTGSTIESCITTLNSNGLNRVSLGVAACAE